jgi:hypothetical protein
MIEIVFNDSASVSLKVAQYYGKGEYRSRGICVLFSPNGSEPTKEEIEKAERAAEERARLAWESATPLGGNPADIYGFDLALSVGNISENQLGSQRQQVLEQLCSIYPNVQGSQATQERVQRAEANLQTVLDRVAEGENLRIWYSNQPDELCGLYWFMAQLNQLKKCCGQIYLVKLPAWEADENGNAVRKAGWGELAAGEWHRYLILQRPVLPMFCQSCASHWQALQKENAPLRAMLNGQLISMPETLYDDLIVREIAAEDEEFHEAMVIGRVLGKYQLGIGDSWVALRIEEMIRAGKLQVVKELAEDSPIYHRILKKCN